MTFCETATCDHRSCVPYLVSLHSSYSDRTLREGRCSAPGLRYQFSTQIAEGRWNWRNHVKGKRSIVVTASKSKYESAEPKRHNDLT